MGWFGKHAHGDERYVTLRFGVSAVLPYSTAARPSGAKAKAGSRLHLGATQQQQPPRGFVSSALSPTLRWRAGAGYSLSRCYAGVGVFGDDVVDTEAEVEVEAEAEVGAEAEVDYVAEFEAEVDSVMEAAEDGEEDGEEEPPVEENGEEEAAVSEEEVEEEEEEGVVHGGPLCDAFSALILELRAAGHGGAASTDSTAIPMEPAPEFTSFSGLTQTQVKMYLGDIRRTIKKYAATACPPGRGLHSSTSRLNLSRF